MQLIKYFLVVFAASGLITWGISKLANKGLQKSQVDFYGKMNAASDSAKETNLLIVGSSRVLVNVDTRIMDSFTRLHSYNYGLNAVTIKTCFNMLQYALTYQKKAKVVLMNIDYTMFDLLKDPYTDAYYYPFESNMPDFFMSNPQSKKRIHRMKLFDIALYDDYVKYASIDGWIRPGRTIPGFFNGYYPHQNLLDFTEPSSKMLKKDSASFTENGFDILNDIVHLTKVKNVKLIFVIAPYFKKYFPGNYCTNYYTVLKRVKGIAEQNNIPFLDYTSLSIADDRTCFYNFSHLNIKGAEIYSKILAKEIRQYLPQ